MSYGLSLIGLFLLCFAWRPTVAWTSHAIPRVVSSRSLLLPSLGVFDKQKDMLEFIEEPMGNSVGDAPPDVPPEEDELAGLVKCIVRAADGRKAENIVALRVSQVSTVTSFVVVLSGNSRPQNQAIAAAVKNDVETEYDMRPGATGVPEGNADSGWVVLDYGSVLVNVMTPKSRLFYNIEGQWNEKGAEPMDISDVIIPNTIEGMQAGGTMDISKDEDPFWS